MRGERDLAIGNLLGSSVYNIAVVLGVTCVGARVSRAEGGLFVVAYLGYLGWLLATRR